VVSPLFPLVLEDAVTRRRGKVLAGPVSLSFESPGSFVVIGPNGSGKTSLLRLMHGTARLNSGTIRWACDLEEARTRQSFVFQRPIVLRRSVMENLIYPLRMRGVTKANARAEGEIWAERVGLTDMLDRPATVLSGGEQQKLALARALITKPEMVFLDEPCASLDSRSMREIEDILKDVKAAGTGLVLSTHDMGQARRLADTILFMLHGKLHEMGPADAFFAGPQTAEAAAFLMGDIVE
jgi:tungstate transport system ATP-binding protein